MSGSVNVCGGLLSGILLVQVLRFYSLVPIGTTKQAPPPIKLRAISPCTHSPIRQHWCFDFYYGHLSLSPPHTHSQTHASYLINSLVDLLAFDSVYLGMRWGCGSLHVSPSLSPHTQIQTIMSLDTYLHTGHCHIYQTSKLFTVGPWMCTALFWGLFSWCRIFSMQHSAIWFLLYGTSSPLQFTVLSPSSLFYDSTRSQ